MDQILKRATRSLRSSATASVATTCASYLRNGFLHLSIESSGCRYRDAGYCTICNYGAGQSVSAEDLALSLETLWDKTPKPVFELLIGSCGSVFDTKEVSDEVLDLILQFLAAHPVPTVIFETHYTTVTTEVLHRVKDALAGHASNVIIEMGLESANPIVLKYSIHKHMNLPALLEKIELIHSFGMRAILNVFLGAPFLPPVLQLADTQKTIAWAFHHGADGVVVFPANIKQGTLLSYLYDKGRYERPSAWLLVELLRSISDDEMGRVEISWYGDRQTYGNGGEALPPYACEVCNGILLRHFEAFSTAREPKARRELINALLRQTDRCACYATLRMVLEQKGVDVETSVLHGLAFLRQEFEEGKLL